MPISTAMEGPVDFAVKLLEKIELVIFDLDGTLADTIEDLANAVNATLRKHGWPERSIGEIKSMVGDGFPPLVKRAVPPHVLEQDKLLGQVIFEASAIYADHCADATRPYPGVNRLIAELRLRQVPCAVLSNKSHEFTDSIVSKLFSEGTFAMVQGETPGTPKKPHPQAALALAAKAGVSPSACVLVGDSPHDMMAACAAGMRAFGAAWGYRTAAELAASGAERVVSSPLELLDFI